MRNPIKSVPPSRKKQTLLKDFISYIILAYFIVVTVYPVVWMISGSLKDEGEFYKNIWGLPQILNFDNYVNAWTRGNMGSNFLNSIIVTVSTVAIVLVCASIAAYALSKINFRGRNLIYFIFLLSLMIPHGILGIPIFGVVVDLGIVNTRISLILVYAGQGMAFSVFLLESFFVSIPQEIEEAALIDGCTRMGAFFRVILPISKPGLATILIYTGMRCWNEYFLASILVRSKELRTLPLGLVNFVQQYSTDYPQLFAALTILTLPMIILFIIGQKQFISGLTAGSVKG